MSTTNTTTGSNASSLQFNPLAQNIYNQLVGGGGNILGQYMNNPFGNPFYQMGAAQSQKGAQAAGANNMAALGQNALVSGLTGQAGAGFLGAQKAQTGRANQAMSSQANVANVMNALNRQMSAAGTGLSFSPQLTGQSGQFSQQSMLSGLGTWLPQLMATGLGAATGGLGATGATAASSGGPLNLSTTPSLSGLTSPFSSGTSGLANPFSGFASSNWAPGFSGLNTGLSTSGLPNPYTASMMTGIS